MKRNKEQPLRWSFTAGERGYRVTVYERRPGGNLYATAWDPMLRAGAGGQRRESLRHRDRKAAIQYAKTQAAKLAAGDAEIRTGRLTLSRLLAFYDEHEIERKRPGEAKSNRRQAQLFTRHFGADKDPARITRQGWLGLTDLRRSGAIDSRGQPVPEKKRRPVRDRTVQADLMHLSAVLNWATRWQDREGRYLLRENPVRGYPVPREKNPRRPIMTQDRYEALLAKAGQVTYEVIVTETAEDGKRRRKRILVPSYLTDLLVLANETGRRISAILGLTYEDVDTERRATAPHGSITWRADLDKKGVEWPDVPMTAAARAAIDRVLQARPGIGAIPLFPSPKDRSKPMDRNLADRWLRECEKLAELDRQEGSLWHAFRRKAATELKGAPDKDVMALLGWKDLRSLKSAYQHADPETMLVALEGRKELRQVR